MSEWPPEWRAGSGTTRRRNGPSQDQANSEQQPAPAQAPAPAPAASEADYTAELEKLAKLRDEGVISADDFEAKKKQLLGI